MTRCVYLVVATHALFNTGVRGLSVGKLTEVPKEISEEPPAVDADSEAVLDEKDDDDGTEMASTLYLATHHKTGSELAHGSIKCWNDTINTEFNPQFVSSRQVWKSDAYVVHFVRNAFSLLVSNYLYHRDVGEVWSKEKGSAKAVVDTLKSFLPERDNLDLDEDVPYTDLLNQVHLKVGILAEMVRMQTELTDIEDAHEACIKDQNQCMNVCLERFTSDSRSFDSAWREIFDFLHVKRQRKTLLACLQRMDLHRNVGRNAKHVTTGSRNEHFVNELLQEALKHDRQFFNNRLQNLANSSLHCEHDYKGLMRPFNASLGESNMTNVTLDELNITSDYLDELNATLAELNMTNITVFAMEEMVA